MKSLLLVSKSLFLALLTVVFLSGCLRSPARHQFGDYSNAEKYYAEGKYEKAIDSYQKYIEQHDDGNLTVIAQYYIAKSYVALENQGEAKKYFQSIIDQYPELIWSELSKEQLQKLS